MKTFSAIWSALTGRVLFTSVILIASAAASYAQLVTFNFTGTSPGLNSPWSTTSTLAAGVTVSTGWSLGTVTGNSTNNRFTATSWSQGATFATASAGNDYVTFSLAPTAGNQVNLSGSVISFSLQNSATGPDFYSVRSSVDNFGSDLSAGSTGLNASGSTTTTALTLPTSVAYTGLTSPIEFRVYGWGASASGGTFSVNSWSMTGSASAIPEPGTYAVIVGGVALVGAWVRRRRSSSGNDDELLLG